MLHKEKQALGPAARNAEVQIHYSHGNSPRTHSAAQTRFLRPSSMRFHSFGASILRAPSTQTISALGPKVCKWDLL